MFKWDGKIEFKLAEVKGKDNAEMTLERVSKTFRKGITKASGYIKHDLRQLMDESIETYQAIDTGALKNSLHIKDDLLPNKAIWTVTYTAPYASFVHYGGMMLPYNNPHANMVYIPGRPWVEKGFAEADLGQLIERGVEEAWKLEFG